VRHPRAGNKTPENPAKTAPTSGFPSRFPCDAAPADCHTRQERDMEQAFLVVLGAALTWAFYFVQRRV
jgi:hypothetical protein